MSHDARNAQQVDLLREALTENAETLRGLSEQALEAGDSADGLLARAAIASQRKARVETLEATPRGPVAPEADSLVPCGCGQPCRLGAQLCRDCEIRL
ncbi:hypothetical protein GO986_08845 [Deinococcus sp. HMF7620]|uniref:Uncharacterized protein n=1 Tax=Deinococcus arboris TaxID=2682977 RepID=A0A7C9HY18_9DEIO|nr:hypothetical protein [Deinococcus arboris]MVN86870.1 hypothetical protein [Deinococcus arboris]